MESKIAIRNNMKQTAVEWLYEHILLTPLDIRSINKCLQQAKEMEKEQIIEAYDHGEWNQGCNGDAKRYYIETYETPKQQEQIN